MDKSSDKNAKFLRSYTGVQTKLYSFILAIIHNRSDADELFQETAVILWKQFDQYREGSDFAAWAIGIAKNKVLEYLRKNKKTRMFMNDAFVNQLTTLSKNSSEDVEDRVKALHNCIKKLAGREQKLLTLRYKNNFSVKKISQLTGNSSNTLYKIISCSVVRLHLCITRTLAQWELG